VSEPESTGHDPADEDGQLRASDADRDAVLAQLQEHTATGRLTPADLELRAEQALGARTGAELAALVRDLPAASPPDTGRVRTWFVSIMGSSTRRGRIRLGRRVTAISMLASQDIDLCHADLAGPAIVLRAFVFIGWPDIYIPDSAELEVSGFTLGGGFDERGSRAAARPGAPRVRIRCYGLLGRHTVWRLPEELQSLPHSEARKAATALSRQSPGRLMPPPGS
jgi:hypothetical protein